MIETHFDRTLPNTTLNVSYTNADGRKAFIYATDSFGYVTGVSMDMEPAGSAIPLVIILGAALVVAGWVLYRRAVRRALPEAPVVGAEIRETDPTPVLIELLNSSQKAYAEGRFPEAYGLAARVLRSVISSRLGSGVEMTNFEILAFLRDSSASDFQQIEAILSRCSDVEFARGEPDDVEFSLFLIAIRRKVVDTSKHPKLDPRYSERMECDNSFT
jgi:hypothetical protein